jgi:hypothetical protein
VRGQALHRVCAHFPSGPTPDVPSVPFRASDPDDPLRLTDATRSLGLVVLRGTAVMVVCPTDGTESIANPFVAQEAA